VVAATYLHVHCCTGLPSSGKFGRGEKEGLARSITNARREAARAAWGTQSEAERQGRVCELRALGGARVFVRECSSSKTEDEGDDEAVANGVRVVDTLGEPARRLPGVVEKTQSASRTALCGVPSCLRRLGVMVSRSMLGQSVAYLDMPCCTGFWSPPCRRGDGKGHVTNLGGEEAFIVEVGGRRPWG
jgi:hypothetical protein